MSDAIVVLKKYSNRRLYDTGRSIYVTLAQVAEMVRSGREVKVVDAKTEEDVIQWVKTMDKAGIEKMIVLTQATGPEFDQIAAKYRKYLDRFQLWCGLNFTGYDQPGFGPAAVAELERCYRAGARGAGEISDKGLGVINQASKAPDMHLDNPRLDPLYEKCADLHMPINLHVGEPIWFYLPMDEKNDGLMNAYHWRLDDKPNLLPHAEMIKVLEVIPT
jgi:predicted TIM-barrel fold metal-dependent hydrolase